MGGDFRQGSGSLIDNEPDNYEALCQQAKTLLEANEAKLTQSTGIYESVSGVNLEEEAANLIRFQQSYAASAQIVNTAKTIFDTLLSSVR